MKDKTKEILDDIKNKELAPTDLTHNDIVKLLDYITNLQKEKDYYFKKNNELSTLNTSLRNDRDIYKTINEKAIELIYKAMKERDITGNGTLNLNELLDILQGKGDE